MVGVPEPLHIGVDRVVLDVWRSHDQGTWARELKHVSLQCGQPRLVEMFNNLDQCCCVKAFKSLVSVEERPMNQLKPILTLVRHLIEPQAPRRDFKALV